MTNYKEKYIHSLPFMLLSLVILGIVACLPMKEATHSPQASTQACQANFETFINSISGHKVDSLPKGLYLLDRSTTFIEVGEDARSISEEQIQNNKTLKGHFLCSQAKLKEMKTEVAFYFPSIVQVNDNTGKVDRITMRQHQSTLDGGKFSFHSFTPQIQPKKAIKAADWLDNQGFEYKFLRINDKEWIILGRKKVLNQSIVSVNYFSRHLKNQ